MSDDAIFRAVMDGQRLHIAYRVGLGDMWDEIERHVLKRPVRFLTEQQREALR